MNRGMFIGCLGETPEVYRGDSEMFLDMFFGGSYIGLLVYVYVCMRRDYMGTGLFVFYMF
jgi:hypothetical protein